MKILALDTSTNACTVGLYVDGEVSEKHAVAPKQHAQIIFSMLDELMRGAHITMTDLDALAFGNGPGSFTGVRIAASVIQGLAISYNLPVVAISTLHAIAQHTHQNTGKDNILVLNDARMHEVYCGVYQATKGILAASEPDKLIAPENIVKPNNENWLAVGDAWAQFKEQLSELSAKVSVDLTIDSYPHAGTIASLAALQYQEGNLLEAHQAVPNYLRNNVAHKSKKVTNNG